MSAIVFLGREFGAFGNADPGRGGMPPDQYFHHVGDASVLSFRGGPNGLFYRRINAQIECRCLGFRHGWLALQYNANVTHIASIDNPARVAQGRFVHAAARKPKKS